MAAKRKRTTTSNKAAAPKKAAARKKAAAPKDDAATEAAADEQLKGPQDQMERAVETAPRIGVPEYHTPTPEALATGRMADRFS